MGVVSSIDDLLHTININKNEFILQKKKVSFAL